MAVNICAYPTWKIFPIHRINSDGSCSCGNPECWKKGENGRPLGSPGKHPRCRNGVKDATNDPEKLEAFRKRYPHSNWALATGPESGCFALDLDGDEGKTALRELESQHGTLPRTLTQISGGGGLHLLFAWPEGRRIANSCRKLGPGIDVKGQGGAIVIAPSKHWSGGHYVWEPWDATQKLPNAPDWLLDLVCAPTLKAVPSVPTVVSIDAVDGAQLKWAAGALESEVKAVRDAMPSTRNDALNRASFALGGLVGAGLLTEAVVRSALMRAALAAGLARPEIEATLASGIKAGIANPRLIPELQKRVAHSGDGAKKVGNGGGRGGGGGGSNIVTLPTRSADPPPTSEKPEIILVEGEIFEIINRAEEILVESGCELYQRGPYIVNIGMSKSIVFNYENSENSRRVVDAPQIIPVKAETIAEIMGRFITFKKFNGM